MSDTALVGRGLRQETLRDVAVAFLAMYGRHEYALDDGDGNEIADTRDALCTQCGGGWLNPDQPLHDDDCLVPRFQRALEGDPA